jgi:hypothetical protein
VTHHPVLDRTKKLRAAVNRLQLDCLDSAWMGGSTPHRFVCPKGHSVFKTPAAIAALKRGCHECELDRNAELLRASARRAGVTWLDQRWLGGRSPYQFRCERGHTWWRIGATAKRCCACPACVARTLGRRVWLPQGLKRMQRMVASHGGACLTQACRARCQRYSFRCAQGHTFEAIGGAVCRGEWCPQCKRDRLSHEGMARLQAVCASRGGVCLTNTFTRTDARYRFRCRFEHEWEAVAVSILAGGWCRRCMVVRKTMALPAAHIYASEHGGQCLSTVYAGEVRELQWVCRRGHVWHAAMTRIRKGDWCPECVELDLPD